MTRRVGLFLAAGPDNGGIFQYSLAVLRAFAALERDSIAPVIVYAHPAWARLLKDVRADIVAVRLGWAKSFATAWVRLGLPLGLLKWMLLISPGFRVMTRQKCDAWIFPGNDIWSYLLSSGKVLAAVHDLMHRYERRFPEVSSGGRFHFRERHYGALAKAASGILVDSDTGKSHVCESYDVDAARVHVLPYVPPDYVYSSECPPGFDDRYALPEKFFFYPAQFWPHKNHLTLVRALAKARMQDPDMALVLAGSKKHEYGAVHAEAKQLGLEAAVYFPGYVPDRDLPEFYRRARALIMPTYFGPTNIPPLEAFALGCPVAVSGIYGMPEQVGDAALLFDPSSEDAISNVLQRLWTDDSLCEELISKGRERSKLWGPTEFGKRFAAIVGRLLEED